MDGVVFYPPINQPDSCLQTSERNKGMRSFVLDDGYLTLPLLKCAVSADNYAGACRTNEGEFEQIVIREFEGKLSSIGLPDPDIHVGKK